ncbi:hypothetical protein Ga0061061_11721 [Chelatococcus sambhunathii]|uniref:Uncharacterized protein n=1 Tax=Chelatococcus sambhunathii TaxID=363953 RepID=A0ABM9UEJ1_9HYPH|nr:hypothetical protein [Chelatococcus sambhunathii]CUA90965.1 hypothetical protein Ga0061061_11721 [Chelatococcus sambhunathii]
MSRKRDYVYEQIINAPRTETALATFHLIDTLQAWHERRGVQINAAVILAVLMCEHLKVDLQDALTAAKNLINTHDARLATEFEAIRMYLREEVK